jgi:hypothetical protein
MLRSTVRAGVLVSGALLLLAGCSGGESADAADPGVPDIAGSSSRQAPPSTAPPPASESVAPTTVQAEQPPAEPAAGNQGECKVADLELSFAGGDSAAGTTYRSLVFTNKGTRTCTIQGFPGVSYVTGDDGHQVGPAAYRAGAKGEVVTLNPGDSASSDIGFVQVANYDPAVCKPTDVRGLRIYPPHEYDSMFIASEGTGCAGTPPGNQLTVGTVKPGTGA